MSTRKPNFFVRRIVRTGLIVLAALCHAPAATPAAEELEAVPFSARLAKPETNSILYNPARDEYRLTYQDGEKSVEYSIRPRDPYISRGMISVRVMVDTRRRIIPLKEAGLLVRTATGEILSTTSVAAKSNVAMVTHELNGPRLRMLYEEELDGRTLRKEYRYSIKGKTLVIEAFSDEVSNATTGYIGFDFGDTLYAPDAKILTLPSSPFPVMSVGGEHFMTTYADPLASTSFRYERTRDVENYRMAQASNTPAWLIEDARGNLPPLRVKAYLTVSDSILDTLPMAGPPGAGAEAVRTRTVLDLNEYPLAQRPQYPRRLHRRWIAPESGLLKLKGSLSLVEGIRGTVEIRLKKAGSGKEMVLFTQILEPDAKAATGAAGEFPVSAGDEISIVTYAPAYMTGGLVGMNLRFELNGAVYSTLEDFAGEPGRRGWWYGETRGDAQTPLVWNETRRRWESADTRAWISPAMNASRAGRPGDAFISGELFLRELRALGMDRLLCLFDGWSARATEGGPMDARAGADAWGTVSTLDRLTKDHIEAGGLAAPMVSLGGLKRSIRQSAAAMLDGAAFPAALPPLANLFMGADQYAETVIESLGGKMRFNAIAAKDFPHHEGLYMKLSATGLLDREGSYTHPLSWIAGQWNEFDGRIPRPALAELRGGEFMNLFWQRGADGVLLPRNPRSNQNHFLDEDLRIGRLGTPRIGMGAYGQFFQMAPDAFADPRVNSLDHYLTSTVLFARAPFLSTKLYHRNMDGHDMRETLLEAYALTRPVADEYVPPENAAERIEYRTADGKAYTANEMLFLDEPADINRFFVKYQNGLRIYGNLSGEPWPLPEPILPGAAIARDGFMAVNDKTGLVSLIGEQSGRPFAAARAGDSFFLNSRSGHLIEVPPLAADGLVYVRNAPGGRRHAACAGVTEVMWSQDLRPLLRTAAPASLALNWITPDSFEIWVFDAFRGPVFLEYFDVPAEWFPEDGAPRLTVEARLEDGGEGIAPPAWSAAETVNGRAGLRFPALHGGSIVTVTRMPGVDAP